MVSRKLLEHIGSCLCFIYFFRLNVYSTILRRNSWHRIIIFRYQVVLMLPRESERCFVTEYSRTYNVQEAIPCFAVWLSVSYRKIVCFLFFFF